MPAEWLYKVNAKGLYVAPEFMERLRSGNGSALRALNQQKLTPLYRRGYTRESRRPDAEGLFWSSTPSLDLIPLIRGGRHSPPAWIAVSLLVQTIKPKKNTWYNPKAMERAFRKQLMFVNYVKKHMKRGEETVSVKMKGTDITAWNMKPNPKFELVVVNRHDRAALLKLLGELDSASNVETWLAARTESNGASFSKALHADYVKWCSTCGEEPTGIKSFAQTLISVGVRKLTRSAGGERYELELR